MLLTPLVLLNMFSVGTVMSESLAEIAKLLPLDSSFTGRTDIWSFALQSLQATVGDRLRLCVLLGQQRDPESAGGQGMGGLRRAQPQRLSRYRARHGPAGAGAADRGGGDQAVARFSGRRRGRQQRPAGDGVAAHLAVRALSVVDGKLLPRPRRSAVVHVPARGVRPALSRRFRARYHVSARWIPVA